MNMRETVEIIKESPMWDILTTGEKLDALLDAVQNIDGMRTSRDEQIDVTDIIGEIFRGYNA